MAIGGDPTGNVSLDSIFDQAQIGLGTDSWKFFAKNFTFRRSPP